MSIVTRIVEHPRKPGRYVVDIDGREYAVVAADALTEHKVHVGAVVDDSRAAKLREAGEVAATYDRALNLLAFRARSSRELRRRLVQKGEAAERVDRVIERLEDVGLLDDADFARQVARSKVSGGAGRRRVHQELFKRGVARDVADEAVDEVMDDEDVDEVALAEQVARKRLPSLAKLDPETRKRRLYAFLVRRGHDSEAIRQVLPRVLREAGGAGADET